MRGVLDTELCGKVNAFVNNPGLVGGSPGTPVSSTNKTNRHEITEIVLKMALNIITPNSIPTQTLRSYAKR